MRHSFSVKLQNDGLETNIVRIIVKLLKGSHNIQELFKMWLHAAIQFIFKIQLGLGNTNLHTPFI